MNDPMDKKNRIEAEIENPQPWMFDMASGTGE